MPDLRPLLTTTDFEAAVRSSFAQPVLILKHSLTCGTSGMAVEEVQDLIDAGPPLEAFIVTIQTGRDVSQAIETRFRIRHESPQALILRDGEVVWHGSHFRVSAAAIRKVLAGLAAAPAP